MLFKNDFVTRYPDVVEGTVVKTLDGEKLGKVSTLDTDSFIVQKGVFFPKDFIFRYEDIRDFRDGEIIVNTSKNDISEWREESYTGWSDVDDANLGRRDAATRAEFEDQYPEWREERERVAEPAGENVRVPVHEEELEAQKTLRQAGEVRIRKIVHTELRHFTVPVMREEVEVERVPITDQTAGRAGATEGAFKEETITIPVMEEEVTITKRPVVKEEVRVQKTRTEEEREVSEQVRKEEVKVDDDVSRKRRKIS